MYWVKNGTTVNSQLLFKPKNSAFRMNVHPRIFFELLLSLVTMILAFKGSLSPTYNFSPSSKMESTASEATTFSRKEVGEKAKQTIYEQGRLSNSSRRLRSSILSLGLDQRPFKAWQPSLATEEASTIRSHGNLSVDHSSKTTSSIMAILD